MRKRIKSPSILASSIGSLIGCVFLGYWAHADSGIFSNSGALGTADQSASVGLSTTKTYLEAIDLGDTTNTTVNGVLFTGSGASAQPTGTGWGFAGTTTIYGGGGTLPGGDLGTLTNKFIYGGNPATITLSGLTVGQTYVLTFYERSWDAAGMRVQNLTASGASTASTVFDEDIGATGQGNLNLLRYTFQAGSATQTLSVLPQNTANTLHMYAFTTEQTFNNAWTNGANWSSSSWSAGVPNAVGSNASFGAQATPTNINLDTPETVGHVQFDGTNAWTLTGTNTLTLQTDVGGVSVLSTPTGSHTIATPIVLNNDAAKMGTGTLTLSGTVSGAKAMNVNGGVLVLNGTNSYTGGTVVNQGGSLRIGSVGALGANNAGLTVNTGGAIDLQGFSPALGSLAGTGGTISNESTGTASVLTIGGGDTGGAFAGVLADHLTGTGTVALVKTGAATATLSGANTYSGLTTVAGGRLQLNGSAATGTLATSGLNIGSAGTFGFSAGAGSTLTLKTGSTLTLGGGTLAFDLGSSTGSDKIAADTFALTANSAFAFTPISGISVGSTYTLVTYNTLSNPSAFSFASSSTGRLSLQPAIGTNAITLTPTLDSGTWASSSGGAWSVGPWTNYTPTAQGDSALFGNALTSNGTVTVDSPRSVGYVTFNNTAASYTIGTAGSGNLTLNNGASPALVTVNGGNHFIAENVTLASDVSFTADAGASITVNGVLTGAKALTKFGAGTLTLTNVQAYTGGTVVGEGTLQLGNGIINGSVTGNITDNSAVLFNPGAAQTFGGVISGSGTVALGNSNVLTLTGVNTFSGGLTIPAGDTVDVGGGTANGSITGTVTDNGTLRFSQTGAITIDAVVNGTGTTILAGSTSQTLSAASAINTPNVTVGDTLQGFVYFGAPNQLNGTTGSLLTIGANAANSRINLNGFNETISGLLGTGIVQNSESVTTTPAATLTINVPGTNSYSWTGLLRTRSGGALSVAKSGTGDQTILFGITNDSYPGSTTISQGRLIFGTAFAGEAWTTSGIAVSAGASLGLTGAGTGALSWNTNSRVISGAGNVIRLGLDTNVVSISNTSNSYTGVTTLSDTGTLAISGLANIGSNSSIGAGNNTSAATNAASLVFDGGVLRYTGGTVNSDRLFTLTQNGGTFDSSGAGAVNLLNTGALASSGSGPRTLNLVGSNTGNNILSGALSDGAGGATSVVKDQAGTWVLRGANTYTGPTTLLAGQLQLEGSAASNPVATSDLTVNAGSTFGFTAGTGSTLTLAHTLTLAGGTVTLDLGSTSASDVIAADTLTLTANTALNFHQVGGYETGATYTLATYNTLNNPNSLTVTGFSAGRLTLNPVLGAHAITLTPVLDSGTWNNPQGANWSTGPWTGYTPTAIGDSAVFGPVFTSGGGVVVVDVPETVGYLTLNNSTTSYTIGTLGSGNLTLQNTDTAAAQIVVNAGSHTLAEGTILNSDLSIFSAAGTTLNVTSGLTGFDKNVTKNGPGALVLNGSNIIAAVANTVFTINDGTVTLGSASVLSTQTSVAVNGGVLDLNGSDTILGSLAGLGGTITDTSTQAGTTTFTINQSSDAIFAGLLKDGAARSLILHKAGTGNLILGGANTFSGGLFIDSGTVTAASGLGPAVPGNVILGANQGIPVWLISGAASQQYGANTVLTFANGGTDAKFELRGSNQTLAGIDATTDQSLSIIQNDEAASAPGYAGAPGAATLTLNTASDHSFYGLIRNQDGGALSIVKTGPGTQTLINRPDVVGLAYTGTTTINAGELVLNVSGTTATAYASDVILNGAGTLGLDGTWTFARAISGSGNVIKQGAGTVTIGSTVAYTGNTTIAAGTLALTGSISGSLNLNVEAGAIFDVSGVAGGFALGATQTLQGTGAVVGTVTANGTVSPGPGLGTLSTGALSFGSGSVLKLDIDTGTVSGGLGQSDLVADSGAFSLSSTGTAPTLSLTDVGSNTVVAPGTQFVLLTYNGTWNGGLFRIGSTTVADDAVFGFGANVFRLDYNAGGNTVELTAVPEPATGAALIAGMGVLLGCRRRRSQRGSRP